MTTSAKLLAKLTRDPTPTDFRWADLVTALNALGFVQETGSGSRCRFFCMERNLSINLHRPHPGSLLKQYQVRLVVKFLLDSQLIEAAGEK